MPFLSVRTNTQRTQRKQGAYQQQPVQALFPVYDKIAQDFLSRRKARPNHCSATYVPGLTVYFSFPSKHHIQYNKFEKRGAAFAAGGECADSDFFYRHARVTLPNQKILRLLYHALYISMETGPEILQAYTHKKAAAAHKIGLHYSALEVFNVANHRNFAIIGGDMRQIRLANAPGRGGLLRLRLRL